ncbi:MAG: helix-turn-helix domain-containing protein [Selenomonadaceae bacterium]|nr:helix-turn-helix domain-containing protein [Selenomonadaceae bacterium]
MTQDEKNKIQQLRQQGYGYVKIAQELNISPNTVKSFCYRTSLESTSTANVCKQCGKPIERNTKKSEKKFCSDACRMKWWSYHQDELKHHKTLICRHCGKSFYGKPGRKYCNHECYIAERFGENRV